MTENTNKMIANTIKTRTNKMPKFFAELNELGYKLETGIDCWKVNGIEYKVYEDYPNEVWDTNSRRHLITGAHNIGKFDFVNYLATFEERQARRDARNAQGNITFSYSYTYKRTYRVCLNPEASWYERKYREWTSRERVYKSMNQTIEKYKLLKNNAGEGHHYSYTSAASAVRYTKNRIASIEAKIAKLQEELAREKQELAVREGKLNEGVVALDNFLKAKGIR